ncbi:MAG TPA: M48 family metallopeptidase, partial [Geobacteraceae bacterium]
MPSPAWLLVPYLLTVLGGWGLRLLNLRHLIAMGPSVPAEFTPYVETATLEKSTAYAIAQNRYGLVEDGVSTALLVLFVFAGLLGQYDRWLASLGAGFIGSGLLFFSGLFLVESLGSIPFSLYHTFVLERRFGFSTTTVGLWLSDLVKGALLSLLLGGGLLAAVLALVSWQPQHWWLWVWGMLAMVTLLLMYLSPVLIEPLFNTYQPVADPELETAIRATMIRAGLRVSAVLQVDASRRSRHSNAYFTGIGRVKRIVLYDTLLQQLTREEIVAVLAHEVGHWRLGHIRKRLVLSEMAVGLAAYGAYRLLAWGGLPSLAGAAELSFAAKLVVLGIVGSVLGALLTPLSAW